ncbi:MAG: lytic transglycosylase domain-containing protein [Desulfobacteraceae bacterium]|nr:lytic transglycosylase domain-containing protein [Desulfobacteraceae bacterium]
MSKPDTTLAGGSAEIELMAYFLLKLWQKNQTRFSMVSKTGMTISDYFQLANIKSDLKSLGSVPPSRPKNGRDTFRQIMARSGNKFRPSSGKFDPPDADSNPTGMRLSDYFRHHLPPRAVGFSPSDTKVKVDAHEGEGRYWGASEVAPEFSADPLRISSRGVTSAATRGRIEASIKKAADKYGLSPALIQSVIKAESNFQVDAVSSAGAQGLMQLMPATAKELGVVDVFDIDANVDGGTRYLKQMLDQFGGDIKLALAAYNAGPGTVQRYGQIPPYRETRNYIDRVMRFAEIPS